MADFDDTRDGLRTGRDALVDRYAEQLTVSEGRAGGDDRTVVFVDVLLPDVTAVPGPGPLECDDRPDPGRARWRMRTSSADRPLRLGRHAARSSALAAYHGADARKGRRVLVTDLDAGQVGAFLAWHYEEGPVGSGGSRRSRRRPHLVVSAGVRDGAAGDVRGAYAGMLWQLFLLVLAIDRRTVQRGRVGVRLDSAVLLTAGELAAFGCRRGPGTRHGGYADDGYYELVA